MRTETIDHVTTRPLTLRAEPLRHLAALWWRVLEEPTDRAAKIQLALAHKEGLDRCPSCHQQLRIEGHRVTQTAYCRRETLACGGCCTEFVLTEEHHA